MTTTSWCSVCMGSGTSLSGTGDRAFSGRVRSPDRGEGGGLTKGARVLADDRGVEDVGCRGSGGGPGSGAGLGGGGRHVSSLPPKRFADIGVTPVPRAGWRPGGWWVDAAGRLM